MSTSRSSWSVMPEAAEKSLRASSVSKSGNGVDRLGGSFRRIRAASIEISPAHLFSSPPRAMRWPGQQPVNELFPRGCETFPPDHQFWQRRVESQDSATHWANGRTCIPASFLHESRQSLGGVFRMDQPGRAGVWLLSIISFGRAGASCSSDFNTVWRAIAHRFNDDSSTFSAGVKSGSVGGGPPASS